MVLMSVMQLDMEVPHKEKAGSSFRLSDRTAPGFGLLIVDPVKQAFHAMWFALMRCFSVLSASVRPTPGTIVATSA